MNFAPLLKLVIVKLERRLSSQTVINKQPVSYLCNFYSQTYSFKTTVHQAISSTLLIIKLGKKEQQIEVSEKMKLRDS